jgi:putative alpha-1,2-mannosidase
MYPVNPANGAYVFGSPLFDKAEINLPEGKKFTFVVENNSKENIYIQSLTLNGEPYTQSFITHKQMMEGGKLVFKMGSKPNKEFGNAAEDRPQSIIY